MQRVFTVLAVVVLVGALLVAMGAPALAQATTPPEPFLSTPPNCENGQDQAFVGAPSDSQQAKHLYDYLDCVKGTPPGEGQGSS